jgi:hypothetical protein
MRLNSSSVKGVGKCHNAWPRWISIDWGFQHPSAVYWHVAVPALHQSVILSEAKNPSSFYTQRDPSVAALSQDDNARAYRACIVTYREFVQSGPLAAHAGASHRRAQRP